MARHFRTEYVSWICFIEKAVNGVSQLSKPQSLPVRLLSDCQPKRAQWLIFESTSRAIRKHSQLPQTHRNLGSCNLLRNTKRRQSLRAPVLAHGAVVTLCLLFAFAANTRIAAPYRGLMILRLCSMTQSRDFCRELCN